MRLLRRTLRHILEPVRFDSYAVWRPAHTLDFGIVTFWLSHQQGSRFSVEWVGRVGIS